MEKTFILNLYIVYLICSTHCVNSTFCKINKFNFIGYKFDHTNAHVTNSYRTNASNTLSNGDSLSNGPIDVKYDNPDLIGSSVERLSYVKNRHTPTLKSPIKCALDSLIPGIFRVLEARKKLGCASIPSLLCCSGGVDSMSLLHSFGLIKQNYECLVNGHIQLNFSSYPINTGGASPDKRSRRTIMMELFDEFYKNFNVIYFNHKQRDDVEMDIEVIRKACQEYKFNLIIEELPSSILQEEGKETGLQNMFRAWRRETCIKIINYLSSINISGSATIKGSSTSGNDCTIPSSVKNRKLEWKGSSDLELEGITNLGDLIGLKGLIFMGHNLDDNFETVLLKILRGSFVSNLTPMELYDNLDHREYMLVRPFLSIKKAKLISFIQSLNETYNEDSSNSKLYYTRNVMRNLIIPEVLNNLSGSIATNSIGNEDVLKDKVENKPLLMGLHTKLKYLSKQCHNISALIEHEVDMYYDYINSKYKENMNCSSNSCNNYSDDALSKSAGDPLKEAYREFYTNLFRSSYNGKTHKLETVFENNINYLRRMGLRFDDHFHLKEWSIIPNRMIKEQVLYRYIVEKTGSNILYRVLYKLVNDLSKEPFSESLKMYSVGSHLMYHQAYYLKLGPNVSKVMNTTRTTATATENISHRNKDTEVNRESTSVKGFVTTLKQVPNNRKLIFSDENVVIYNCIDKLNIAIAKPQGRYHINLKLEPAPASTSTGLYDLHHNSGNLNGLEVGDLRNRDDRQKLELEIRYLKEDDVSTSRKMWSNSVYKILGNIGLHRFFKDEIPALVIVGTNDVIGIYGYNLSPPYRNRDSQTILYHMDGIKRPSQYQLTIL
ncbi:hypothetical protein MACJ_002262 [Theileria orientalis]|uniref:tRNA(Ile)-lysidine synthetase n=1 Tax=Theileria orientalis TaxID=68886 RepID=A0A976M8A4_THEOR|nr:hypothetical protein MACJ_002262 [Theileria orientalis]